MCFEGGLFTVSARSHCRTIDPFPFPFPFPFHQEEPAPPVRSGQVARRTNAGTQARTTLPHAQARTRRVDAAVRRGLARATSHDWAWRALLLGRFWDGPPCPFAQRRWGLAGEDYGAPVPCTGDRGGLLSLLGCAGLLSCLVFPASPQPGPGQGWYLSTPPVLHAAWCSALLRSRAGAPVLSPPAANLCPPFHSLFLSSILPLPEQISTSSSPSLSPFSSIRNQSFPLPHRPFQHPPRPPSPRGLPFSVREKEGRRRFRLWATDKLASQPI